MQLSAEQIEGVLSRNSDLRARVVEFNLLRSTFTWEQLIESGWMSWTFTVPGWIPPDGVYVVDSQFGNVVVFPDASGTLRFNSSVNVGSAHLITSSGLPPLPKLPNLNAVVVLLILVSVGFILFEVAPFAYPLLANRRAAS